VILINIGSAFMIVQRVDLKTSSVPSSTLDRTILGDHRVNHPSLSTGDPMPTFHPAPIDFRR